MKLLSKWLQPLSSFHVVSGVLVGGVVCCGSGGWVVVVLSVCVVFGVGVGGVWCEEWRSGL